jgi:hypothetical protein
MSLEAVFWGVMFLAGFYALAVTYMVWRLYLFGKTVSNEIRVSGIEDLDDEREEDR